MKNFAFFEKEITDKKEAIINCINNDPLPDQCIGDKVSTTS